MDIDDPGDYIASVACQYDEIGYNAIKYIAENKPGAKFSSVQDRKVLVYMKNIKKVLTVHWKN